MHLSFIIIFLLMYLNRIVS